MNITEDSDNSRYNNTGYYLTPDLSQRLDLIRHLLVNTGLIPFVQAAEGSGKSRLAQHLAEILTERYSVFPVEGESAVSAKGLASRLAQATGAAPHEVIDDEQLALQLKALHEQNKTLLILVDDAEQIPAETLSWLIEKITGQQESFICKCVLFSAVDVLALPLSPVSLSKLKDSIQTLDIPPITPDQLPGFVASIDPLKSAVIDDTQYAALMKNSSGIIGKILWQLQYIDNNLMPQQESDSHSSSKMKPLYVVAGILFVSAMASLLIFQDEINLSMSANEPVAEEKELEVINLPLPPQVVAVQENEQQPPREDEAQQLMQPIQQELPETEPGEIQNSITETKPAETQPAENVEPVPQVNPVNQPQAGEQESEQASAVVALQSEANENPPAIDQPEVDQPEVDQPEVDQPEVDQVSEKVLDNELRLEPEAQSGQPTDAENIDNPAIVSTNADNAVSVKQPASQPLPKPGPPTTAKRQPRQEASLQPIAWVLNQPDNSYTLQLLAASEEKGIKRFIQQHKFNGNLAILKTKRNGKPWYALLYGSYASRDEALNARINLPKSYKSSSAWPRSVLSIRQAIAAN